MSSKLKVLLGVLCVVIVAALTIVVSNYRGSAQAVSTTSSVVDQLNIAGTQIEVTGEPAGIAKLHAAFLVSCTNTTGIQYKDFSPSKLTYTLSETGWPSGYKCLDLQALNSSGGAIGSWAGRKELKEAPKEEEKPKEEPPSGKPHVAVIVEENRSESEAYSGNAYLTKLASEYGKATQSYGVTHPSEPNYLAMISGSTQGRDGSDSCESISGAGSQTLASQLSSASIRWKAYMESMSSGGYNTCESGGYAKKHDPFAFFTTTDFSKVVPGSQFSTDVNANAIPDFIYYTPNLCNDGHDSGCSVSNSLEGLVKPLLASKWYTENGTIFVTYDEGSTGETPESHIATVVINANSKGRTFGTRINHYGLLATIENLYKLPLLGKASGAATFQPLLEKAKEEEKTETTTSVVDRLSADKTFIEVTGEPAGTAKLHLAEMKDLNATGVTYRDVPASEKTWKTTKAGYPCVDMQAINSEGKALGNWAGRKCVETLTEPPKEEEKTTGTFNVGLDSGGWLLTNDSALNSGKMKLQRSQNMSNETISNYESKGWKMDDLIGHNPATGVNAESLANEAVARAKAHPNIVASEILNEPQNPYLSGSESQANIEAYARVFNKVADRFVAEKIKSVPLWSADGGFAGVPSWGAKVWPLLDTNARQIGRPTVHPYGGTGNREQSALGGRERVRESFALTKEKVWVTEVGWPTCVGCSNTGDSLQWTESEQAKNIKSFIEFAKAECETVIIFQYRDYSPNNYYGIETSGGTHKLSFNVVEELS